MRIKLVSVLVEDQEHALRFYTETLGFEKKMDLPAGEYRWLTVVSPEEPNGTEVSLEPNVHPAANTYQKAIYEAGIPMTSFEVDNVSAEHARLEAKGVRFTMAPTEAGETVVAILDDTCGNLIQIHQA